MLIAHGHYTIDIIISLLLTFHVFCMYHLICSNMLSQDPTVNNFATRVWCYYYWLKYIKENVDVVPMEYEWPLPWPRCFL